MDREFLFRGKRADDGKWIEGFLTISKDEYHIIDLNDEYITALVILDTIGEYTNCKDKSGTKIYEGDIVTDNGGETLYVCVYDDGRFILYTIKEYLYRDFSSYEDRFITDICEVVGNIHDNPELLGKGD